jgi:hypothetical protein
MKVQQRTWSERVGWSSSEQWSLGKSAQLVMVFGRGDLLSGPEPMASIRAAHPFAQIVGCSTAGEICGTRVQDDSLVATALAFDTTRVRATEVEIAQAGGSEQAGATLAQALSADDLAHVLVFSDGLLVNGTELVKGLCGKLPAGVAVTGGLSADGARFEKTQVYFNGKVGSGRVVAIGLYGSRLRVGYSSLGGWDPFGPERLVTRSKGNVLYELDGESALEVYKRYLGPDAADLPASGLRFPLSVRSGPNDTGVVRTILAINEQDQSLTFAGDVPQGMYARLMRTNFDRLIEGATDAGTSSRDALGPNAPEFAILISCVGRKLVLQQRTEEEVEGVRSSLGKLPVMAGFYSYGEISPFTTHGRSELHNQTMTITAFSEAA